MKNFKNLNCKMLSTLPVIGLCLVTTYQTSNAMFKNNANNLPKALQPTTAINPNPPSITHLYRGNYSLTILDTSPLGNTNKVNTTSTKNSPPTKATTSTNIYRSGAKVSIIDNKNSTTKLKPVSQPKSPTSNSNDLFFARYVELDIDGNFSPPTTPSKSPSSDSDNLFFARYIELSSDDEFSPPTTPPKSPTPDSNNLFFARYVELDSDGEFSSPATPPKSPTSDSDNLFFARYVELNSDDEFSSPATPPKSPTSDSDNLFFARYVELNSDDEFSPPTPPKSPSFDLNLDSINETSSVAIPPKPSSNISKLKTYFKKHFDSKPEIDLEGYKAGMTFLSSEGLRKVLEKEVEIKNDPSQNSNEELQTLKNNLLSLTSFTFKDLINEQSDKQYKKSVLNSKASLVSNQLNAPIYDNLDILLLKFKEYIKVENNPSKINQVIGKLSDDFGNNTGTKASNDLLTQILKFK